MYSLWFKCGNTLSDIAFINLKKTNVAKNEIVSDFKTGSINHLVHMVIPVPR